MAGPVNGLNVQQNFPAANTYQRTVENSNQQAQQLAEDLTAEQQSNTASVESSPEVNQVSASSDVGVIESASAGETQNLARGSLLDITV